MRNKNTCLYCAVFQLTNILNIFAILYKNNKRTMMKQISLRLLALGLIVTAWSCGSGGGPQGQLVGTTHKVTNLHGAPVGMTWVPSGVMHMGASDQDMRGANDVKNRTVQMIGFWMDATEITNAEYRQYVDWVRDSTAHSIIGDYKDLDDGRTRFEPRLAHRR